MTVQTQPRVRRPLTELVAEEVRALKGRRSLSQQELAEVLGVNQGQVSARLRGKIPFTLQDVDRLADFFGVDPEYLMGNKSAPGPEGPGGGSALPRMDSNHQPADDVSAQVIELLSRQTVTSDDIDQLQVA